MTGGGTLVGLKITMKKLMSLNVWKSAGLDRISNRVLKECAEIFTSPTNPYIQPLIKIWHFSITMEERFGMPGIQEQRKSQ